jgi:hypothetical protein
MDKALLKQRAEALEALLLKYGPQDADVRSLRGGLRPFLDKAKAQMIDTPLEWREIPGGYLFSERGLRKYGDLEQAFAKFRIEATGGEPPALKKFRERMRKEREAGQ